MPKETRIALRLTEEEKAQISEAAKADGRSVSNFILNACRKEIEKQAEKSSGSASENN